jgi:hypothetical protein
VTSASEPEGSHHERLSSVTRTVNNPACVYG